MPNPKVASAVSGLRSHHAECFCLAWTAGMLAAFLDHAAAGILLAAGCVLVCTVFCLPLCKAYRGNRFAFLLMAAGLLCGTAVWQHYDRTVRAPLFAMDGQTVTLTGTVTACGRTANDGTVYTLRTVLADRRVSVDWYAGDAVSLKTGDTVTLSAKLTRITQDYASHTADTQAGMGKYLRIYSADVLDIQEDTGFSLLRTVQGYREQISYEISSRLSADSAALMNGMLFGDKTALDDDLRESLYAAGIGHITAVSGMHLVFFWLLVMRLLGLFHLPHRLRFLLGCGAIGLFVLLADGSASVRRAALMLILSQSAPLFGRKVNTLHSLSLAMLLCTLFTPYVIGAAGFWLSVSGVLGIGVIAPDLTKRIRHRSGRKILQLCCVSAAVFPASVLLLGQGSLLSPLSNLVILPFGAAALYLGLLTVCTGGLTAFLLPLVDPLCRVLLYAAQLAAKIPFSQVQISSSAVRFTVALVTLLLLFLLALQIPRKHIVTAFLLCCTLLFGQSVYTAYTERQMLQIAVLGRKNDCAVVILTNGETYIADMTGAVRNPRYVRELLRSRGITEIGLLVGSSGANSAAYAETLRSTEVRTVRVLADGESVSADYGALSLTAEQGRLHLTWNGYTAEILPAA
ncbi:MAG: ComEC/Rec2 family competence protein, partial [Oscillospiraceae bacterium]|nr:ComEC/Rec2 family competence protein [Oscillospiraceae bacterium]